MLITTHYMDEADRLCDRIAIVDHGKLVALDTPMALKASVPGSNVIEAQFTQELRRTGSSSSHHWPASLRCSTRRRHVPHSDRQRLADNDGAGGMAVQPWRARSSRCPCRTPHSMMSSFTTRGVSCATNR